MYGHFSLFNFMSSAPKLELILSQYSPSKFMIGPNTWENIVSFKKFHVDLRERIVFTKFL